MRLCALRDCSHKCYHACLEPQGVWVDDTAGHEGPGAAGRIGVPGDVFVGGTSVANIPPVSRTSPAPRQLSSWVNCMSASFPIVALAYMRMMECMMGMGHTGIMSSADVRGVNKSELMRALGRGQRRGEFLCLAGASEARTWTAGTASSSALH